MSKKWEKIFEEHLKSVTIRSHFRIRIKIKSNQDPDAVINNVISTAFVSHPKQIYTC